MTESFFGLTDTGKLRDNNEDNFIAQKVQQFIAACVIDGVGGYEGGEVAAQIARDAILDYLRIPSGDVLTMMKEAVKAANEKIYAEKHQQPDRKQMACVLTLALADTKNNQFYYAHVGDTRLYLLRGNTLIKVTKDHSFVGFLEDSGRLSEEEAMSHPKRNEIDKALGFDPQISINTDYIETGESPFLPGDVLVLCSDGLTDMVNNSSMTSILIGEKNLQDKAKDLIAAANEAGGKDNITVVLVQNNKKPKKQKATKPAVALKKNEPAEEEPILNEEEPVTNNAPEEIVEIPAPKIPGKLSQMPIAHKKKTNGIVLLLSVLSVLLLAGFLWQLLKHKKGNTFIGEESKTSRNIGEQQLLDSLNRAPGKTLFLTDTVYGRYINVTNPISIDKDSLYVYGNGIRLKSDSAYSGPGLLFAAGAKNIILENMVFENFDIGIITDSRIIQLKNIRFINCRVPVQYDFHFPANTYVNGTIADSLIFKTSSLPK